LQHQRRHERRFSGCGYKYGDPLEAGFLHQRSDVILGAALLECCLTVRAGRADGTDAAPGVSWTVVAPRWSARGPVSRSLLRV
jgi:hypothetical protein